MFPNLTVSQFQRGLPWTVVDQGVTKCWNLSFHVTDNCIKLLIWLNHQLKQTQRWMIKNKALVMKTYLLSLLRLVIGTPSWKLYFVRLVVFDTLNFPIDVEVIEDGVHAGLSLHPWFLVFISPTASTFYTAFLWNSRFYSYWIIALSPTFWCRSPIACSDRVVVFGMRHAMLVASCHHLGTFVFKHDNLSVPAFTVVLVTRPITLPLFVQKLLGQVFFVVKVDFSLVWLRCTLLLCGPLGRVYFAHAAVPSDGLFFAHLARLAVGTAYHAGPSSTVFHKYWYYFNSINQ